MIEYVLLLATTSGTQWYERAMSSIADNPAIVWGGGGALVLLLVWVLKPNR